MTFEWAIEEQSWKVVIEILVPEKADFDHNRKKNYYAVRCRLIARFVNCLQLAMKTWFSNKLSKRARDHAKLKKRNRNNII